MEKTILVTGATDGIGREAASLLVALGYTVLLHGRNPAKLEDVKKTLAADGGQVEGYVADLSCMADVESLANAVVEKHARLDVLINNAGVYNAPKPITPDGLDIRFVVNAIAPYLLTKRLMPLMTASGRVINVSSAAQSPVNLNALAGRVKLTNDFTTYAQSKLALMMWSRVLALKDNAPVIVTVNPGSMLGTKMVKKAFGVAGGDIRIGAEILTRAALSDEFSTASGQYFDNDPGQFSSPHMDALNLQKSQEVVDTIEEILGAIASSL